MNEHCPYCGLDFVTLRNAAPGDPIWTGLSYHLANCPPIVTEEGQERLINALCGLKESGRRAGPGRHSDDLSTIGGGRE